MNFQSFKMQPLNNHLTPFMQATEEIYDLKFEEAFDNFNFKRGESVYSEGNTPRGIYYLKQGKVKVSKLGSDGKQQITKLAKDGDYLGYKELLSDNRYNASAVALEDSEVYFIPKQDFFEMMEENPGILQSMLLMLTKDVTHAEEKVVEMAYTPVRGRLVNALLMLGDTYQNGEEVSTITLSRSELANIVGTATETVIRLLNEFKQDNLIAVQGRKIKILDVEGLQSINKMFIY